MAHNSAKPIRVFGYLNHLGHQYDMLKIAKSNRVKFSYLENNVRRWAKYSGRPEPTTWLNKDQFEWVQYYEPGKYDVAILHVDQQIIDPLIGKGQTYRALNKIIQDIPKIVINHGTPMYDPYEEDVVINGGMAQTRKGLRRLDGMKELIGDNFMVVNSYDSVSRWGWGYPLIHGLSKEEYFDLRKEPRVVLPLSPGGLDKYYNRSLCTAIKGAVRERTGLDVMHTNVNIEFNHDNWAEYREFLGSSLIAIFPFKDSPMPRSRTEAMLSGCCVLSSRYHGAEEFISHGIDGFIVPDNPLSYAEAIHLLINDCYKEAVEVGQRAKEKASTLFDINRYHDQLYDLLVKVANGERPKWNGDKIW